VLISEPGCIIQTMCGCNGEVNWGLVIFNYLTGWLLFAGVLPMAAIVCYVRYRAVSIRIPIPIFIVFCAVLACIFVGSSRSCVLMHVALVMFTSVAVVWGLGSIYYVRYCGSSNSVSPGILQGEDSADAFGVSEQRNLPRTLVSNAGWIRVVCNPSEIQQTSVSVDESEPPSSLHQQTSSTILGELLHLFQTASLERAQLKNIEDSQVCQLKERFARVKTAGQTEAKHNIVKEDRICQLEKEISEFKTVSEQAARRKKAEDDARFLEFQLLFTAVWEDEIAATTKRKEDPISNSKENDVVVSHMEPQQGSECVICLRAEAVMALMPCRHLCVCESPACMLHQCPMCRAPVVEVRRIYGSRTQSNLSPNV